MQILTGVSPLFCAKGIRPRDNKGEITLMLFASYDEALAAGKDMLHSHFLNVTVTRVDEIVLGG